MQLILVRHGLPQRVELERGRADPPLADVGRQQARLVAAVLAAERIDAIYSSPLRRAIETAAPLAQALGMQPAIREGLAEFDRGAARYIPMEELKAEDYAAWKTFVDGGYGDEANMEEFSQRVSTCMEGIIKAHRSERVAVFCHGGVVNVWAAAVLGMGVRLFVDVDYASISRFLCASTGERNLLSLNETQHTAPPSKPAAQ